MKISNYIEKAYLTISGQNVDLFQRPQKTYFTFVLDKTYAICSEDIKEIIPYHHRDESIMIVNTKAMLISPDQADSVAKNLMVIQKNKIQFALTIDSFKFFISTGYEDSIKYANTEKLIIREDSGDFKILHLLDLDSIARKISTKL